MMKLFKPFAFAFFLTLAALPSWAQGLALIGVQNTKPSGGGPTNMSTPIFITSSVPSTTSATYANFGSPGTWSALVNRQAAWPIAGTISNLNIVSLTTVASNYYTFTLNVAGSDTALVCSVGTGGGTNLGTTTTCSDSSHTISIAQGALVTIESSVPGGTATAIAANGIKIAALFTSTNGQQSPIPLGTNAPSTTAINYLGPASSWQTTDAVASFVVPTAGTINNLFVQMASTAGAGHLWNFTVFQNGVATSIVAGDATHCGGASSTQCSDTTHSITVAALDTISIQSCPSNTATCPAGSAPSASNMSLMLNFTPTTANQAILPSMTTSGPPVSVSNNFTAVTGNYISGSTENVLQITAPVLATHMTLGGLTVAQCPGPDTSGSGVTRTVTLRDAASSKTPTATVAASTTACPTLSTIQDNTHTYQATSSSLLDLLTTLNTVTNASTLTEFKTSMWVTVP
jgi:hypothetical protein